MLLVGPWTIRNYKLFDQFIPFATSDGFALLIGNNPNAEGHFYLHEDFFKDIQMEPDEAVFSKLARKKALNYMADHPLEVIKRIPTKVYYFFWPGMDGISWNLNGESFAKQHFLKQLRFAANGYFLLLMIAFTVALILKIIKRNWHMTDSLYVILLVYYILISIVFFGESRYHFHLIPFIHLSIAGLFFRPQNESLTRE